jgi:hypothetical protein
MNNLPIVEQNRILSFLCVEDMIRCKSVNKEFYSYVNNNIFECSKHILKSRVPTVWNVLNQINDEYSVYGNALSYLFRNVIKRNKNDSNFVVSIKKGEDVIRVFEYLTSRFPNSYTGSSLIGGGHGFLYSLPTTCKKLVNVYFIQHHAEIHIEIDKSSHYIFKKTSLECYIKLDPDGNFYSIIPSSNKNLHAQIISNIQSGIRSLVV